MPWFERELVKGQDERLMGSVGAQGPSKGLPVLKVGCLVMAEVDEAGLLAPGLAHAETEEVKVRRVTRAVWKYMVFVCLFDDDEGRDPRKGRGSRGGGFIYFLKVFSIYNTMKGVSDPT
jgi:hypothetical protein